LTDAQLRLNNLIATWNWYTGTPTEVDAAIIRANHEANLAALQEAQWYLAALKGGQIPQTATGSKLAELRQARERLQAAERRLERSRLVAPIDGVVSAVKIEAYEWTTPGATVIQLLDLSRWRLMTRNVGELQIGRIQLGQEARIVVNAFRNDELTGQVVEIAPDSTIQQGDVTYTLWIELEPTELNLRPGMTAQVVISTEP
jgi:multidrug resistance efflux pump